MRDVPVSITAAGTLSEARSHEYYDPQSNSNTKCQDAADPKTQLISKPGTIRRWWRIRSCRIPQWASHLYRVAVLNSQSLSICHLPLPPKHLDAVMHASPALTCPGYAGSFPEGQCSVNCLLYSAVSKPETNHPVDRANLNLSP